MTASLRFACQIVAGCVHRARLSVAEPLDARKQRGIGASATPPAVHAARVPPTVLSLAQHDFSLDREAAVAVSRPWPIPRCAARGRVLARAWACSSLHYAENECNYCARCQTGDRLLADRSLSRLLRGDWPRTLEELEEHRETSPR